MPVAKNQSGGSDGSGGPATRGLSRGVKLALFAFAFIATVTFFIVLFMTPGGIFLGVTYDAPDVDAATVLSTTPGYNKMDGYTINAMPLKNGYILNVEPGEVERRCMQGQFVSPGTLTTSLGCNQSKQCTAVRYDHFAKQCTLMGSFIPFAPSLLETSTGTTTFLKNCECISAPDAPGGGGGGDAIYSRTCGTGSFGAMTCPGRSCVGESMRTYCCNDASSDGDNVYPGSCANSPMRLAASAFVPYMFFNFEESNFDGGCISEANCPIITFGNDSSWDDEEQAAFHTMTVKRKQNATVRSAIAQTCLVENVRCSTDCVAEMMYMIGVPSFLPHRTSPPGSNLTKDDIARGVCVKNPRRLTASFNRDGNRSPDTVVLTKGRLMVPTSRTGEVFNVCEANNTQGNFDQDVIVARLNSISNYRDWAQLMLEDTILQRFLRDTRFPSNTKFMWHPGSWTTSDGVAYPYGIQTDGDSRSALGGASAEGNRFCSVWVDANSFTESASSTNVCDASGRLVAADENPDVSPRAWAYGGFKANEQKNQYGACSPFLGSPVSGDYASPCKNWVLPVQDGAYTYSDPVDDVDGVAQDDETKDAETSMYAMVNGDYIDNAARVNEINGNPSINFEARVRDAYNLDREITVKGSPTRSMTACARQAGVFCQMTPSDASSTCPGPLRLCDTEAECNVGGVTGYTCDTSVGSSKNYAGACVPDIASDDSKMLPTLGICAQLDAMNGDLACTSALGFVLGDYASPELSWCIRDNEKVLVGGQAAVSGSDSVIRNSGEFTGNCWIHDTRPYIEQVSADHYTSLQRGNNVSTEKLPVVSGCCLNNDCTPRETGRLALFV
jgi:hypothetical protein